MQSALSSTREHSSGKGLLVAVGVVVLLVAVIGGCGIGQYNGLVTAKKNVEGRWAEIDNQYRRRADLVPQLVETVKGAANFERSTLEAVTEARASVARMQLPSLPEDPRALEAYLKAQQNLGGALTRLFAVAESYPDLKASKNFLSLQDQLEGTENRIATARRDYIEGVQGFNTKVSTFPGKLFASLFGFKEAEQFQATSEERTVPKVQFDFEKK